MPKYYPHKVAGYYLYFTSHCVMEAMHVHAGNEEHHEQTAAKFFVLADGSSRLMSQGELNDRAVLKVQEFIKQNYLSMYDKWRKYSDNGFYIG